MASATSYNVLTNREDISNDLSIITPEETPIFSMIKKGSKPGNVFFEWPVDTLAAVTESVVAEGQDVSSFANAAENRQRLGNYVQRNDRAWQVSDFQQELDSAGVANEAAQAKSYKLRELKRDIEARIGSDRDRVSTGPSYETRGLGDWLDSAGPSDVPAAYRTPSASIDSTATGSLAESNVGDVLTSIYKQSGKRKGYMLVCGPSLKRAISNFSRITGTNHRTFQVTQSAESKKITLNVETYDGDFGSLDLVPDLFLGYGGSTTQNIRDARGYVIDPDLLAIRFLNAPFHMDLQDEGGGPRGVFKCIWGLECRNPLGFGKFAATS